MGIKLLPHVPAGRSRNRGAAVPGPQRWDPCARQVPAGSWLGRSAALVAAALEVVTSDDLKLL